MAEAGAHAGASETPDAGGAPAGRGASGMDAAANGGSGGQPTQLQPPQCPTLISKPNGEFCYDFEEGAKGPDEGDAYGLWDTPENPTSAELATREEPGGSGNQVLYAAPPSNGMYPSATIGHDIARFSRAVADFDFWANSALLDVAKDVVFFRFVPDDRDYDHVTSLALRGGQALLRTESGEQLRLSHAPSASERSHVRVELERGSSCSVRVFVDGSMVAASAAGSCAPGDQAGQVSFVEYGLVVLEGAAPSISALYDNIALGVE